MKCRRSKTEDGRSARRLRSERRWIRRPEARHPSVDVVAIVRAFRQLLLVGAEHGTLKQLVTDLKLDKQIVLSR